MPRPHAGRRPPPSFDYVGRTRRVAVNLLFLMPWLAIYQLALFGSGTALDNAAAAWLRSGVSALGREGFTYGSLVVSLLLCLVVLLRLREASRDRGVFGGMLLESVVYGALLGIVAQTLAQTTALVRVEGPSWAPPPSELGTAVIATMRIHVENLGLALGAGIFEELLFRGALVGGGVFVIGHLFGAGRTIAALIMVPIAAWVFSAWHHAGPGGEPYVAEVFAFRLHAGLVLGTIYVTRGLGIAALAHGFYDVLVFASR